jgi:hypothetical protein
MPSNVINKEIFNGKIILFKKPYKQWYQDFVYILLLPYYLKAHKLLKIKVQIF